MPRTRDEKTLNDLYDHLNRTWWRGQLPKIPIRWSRRMYSIAGKYWHSRRGWEIVLSLPYHEHYPHEVEGILKHEMIHVWQHQKGLWRRGVAHDRAFTQEADRVGALRYGKSYRGMHGPYRYEWQCPQCGRRSRSRIRRVWVCAPCCQRYNRGAYSQRFQLKLVRALV
jgi:predicted SprT family Zn-dependent metalloprotease